MNQLNYRGIVINTESRYYKFSEGDIARIVDNGESVEVTYPKGIYSKDLAELLGLKCTENMIMNPTTGDGCISIHNTTVSLNGLVLTKITSDPHVIRVVLVDDHPSRVAQTYLGTTIVVNINDRDDEEFKSYVFSNLKYLKCKSPRLFDWKSYVIYNYPKLIIGSSDLTLNSTNDYIHKLRSNHDRYIIKAIDYEHQFFHDISVILEEFGVQLTRVNREETLENTSYVSYSINQTPMKYVHPRYGNQEYVLCHTIAIDFTLSTPDMILFFDFKNRYNNVHLLTNYAEFKAKDKYGTEWTAAIKWGPITEEFNHTYGTDNNTNFANQCNFRAELYFYEVYDVTSNFIDEIILELKSSDSWES